MTNPAGTRWATTVASFFASHGFPWAERRATRGRNDAGDIAGFPGWVLELKATKGQDLAGAMNQAQTSARKQKPPVPLWAAIFKRKSHGTGRAYVVMELEPWTLLVRAAGFGVPLTKEEERRLWNGEAPPGMAPLRTLLGHERSA